MFVFVRICTRLASLAFSILLLGVASAEASDRWAIVVGNAAYDQPEIGSLENTVNDARTMAASLTNMGFNVTLLENATRSDVDSAIAVIGKDMPDADLGLFYFAGHGLQQRSVNYLLPSDIDPRQPNFLEEQGISINTVVGKLKDTGIDKLVVILDSCRNSPFGEDQAFGVGLALVDAPDDTIVAYSTAPGAVALDGIGANSPFTAALASVLEGPKQDVRDVLRLVRAKVRFATGGAQTPWYIDNSRTEILIQPRDEVDLPAGQEDLVSDTISLETTAWRTISRSSDANDFQMFAELYPNSELSGVAREQVALLRSTGVSALPGMDLGVPDPNPQVPNGLGSIITECDVLATGIGDVYGLVEPVPHDLVNTRAALRACIEAVSNDEKNPRLLGLLGRVLKLSERYEEARYYYISATEEGNSSAYGGLVELYRFGLGVEKDDTRAAYYARQGAMQGNAPMRVALGNMYRQGWGVPQSFSEARRWTEIAAISGYPGALTALGDFYRRGQGVPKDPAKALLYFRAAAAQGKTDAMNNIGMAYMRGEGVEEDTTQGLQWLSRASEEGNPYSAYHLGRAFRRGWGVEADPVQAIAFFRLSAQRNFLGAYNEIGDLLLGEEGLEADLPEAYANYIIAMRAAEIRGTIAAQEHLDAAKERLAALEPRMTDEQVVAGTKIATDWIEQYGLLDFTLVGE